MLQYLSFFCNKFLFSREYPFGVHGAFRDFVYRKPDEDENQKWAHVRDTVHATAASILGYKKRKNQDWFDENYGAISCLLEQKRIAFVKTLEDTKNAPF